MSLANRISIALFCTATIWMTGCVGPMACGPGGACGPIAFNDCDGCGDCQGCGELYIDPWINEPADCCDPCDRCGNYNGQSCGKCRSVFAGFPSLWGYRCSPGCDSGCDSCGVATCDGGCDAVPVDVGCGLEPACGCEPGCGCDTCVAGDMGVVENMGDAVFSITKDPTPAKQISKAKPKPAPYKPRRTRQIFKPRGTIAEGKVFSITR